MPSGTQYDRLRDGDFAHLRHTDEDDRIATQKMLNRVQRIGDNHAANNAIIEKITCINFMCHDKLEVELGPLINFVVGVNGSGKSAVLTAITLCLGGKASSTNRGSSLKSLLKDGTEQGVLIIRLKNQGTDAYQPDNFGPSIIVERHFSRSGGGGYKLKNANGRVMSTRKSDVDDVVEYFQLQADNPMNVLTQDAAKTFITASTPRMKYDFFVKGVQLEQLDNDYRVVADSCDNIGQLLDSSKDDVGLLKKDLDQKLERKKLVDQHEPMRRQRRMLGRQLAWAQVIEQEQELVRREADLQSVEQRMLNLEEQVITKGKAFDELVDLVNKASLLVQNLEEDVAALKAAEEEASEASDAAKQADQNAHTSYRKCKEDLRQQQDAVKQCKQQIEEEMQRLETMNGGGHARLHEQIEQAKEAAETATQVAEAHTGNLVSLQDNIRNAKLAYDESKRPLEAKQAEIVGITNRLEALRRNKPDPFAAYGPKLSHIQEAIARDAGFREKPIGPLGAHIRLQKPQWGSIIEKILSAATQGWIVTHKADQVRLSSILQRHNMRMPIFIFSGPRDEPFDTSGKEPDPEFDTILRVLEFDSVIIRNHLLVSTHIDQLLLIEDRSMASRVMNHGAPPRNVKSCFTMNPRNPECGHRLFHTGPAHARNPAEDFVDAYQGKRRIMTNVADEVPFLEQSLARFQQEKSALEAAIRERQKGVARAEQALSQHKMDAKAHRIAIQRADVRVSELEQEYDKVNVEDGKLEVLRKDLEEAQMNCERVSKAYGDQGLLKKELTEKATAARRVWLAAKKTLEEQDTKIEAAKRRHKRQEDARHLMLVEKNSIYREIEETKRDIANAQARVERQNGYIAEYVSNAERTSARVPVDEGQTTESLKATWDKLGQQIERCRQQQGGDDNQVITACAEAQEKYTKAVQYRQEMEHLYEILKRSFALRMEQYRKFQRLISAASRINFSYLLSERAFRGKLTIDHHKKMLDIHVEPDSTVQRAGGRATKTLSGGEKSFSSICLLLSIWEAMGAPLRCLDEFDVFMDDVNRDVSTKMIVSPLDIDCVCDIYLTLADKCCSSSRWTTIPPHHAKGAWGRCPNCRGRQDCQVGVSCFVEVC